MVLTSIIYVSCTKEDKDELGSIYGIVTKLGTAEPMKAVGVELYKKGTSASKDALLLKTVTFDDGHFEFKDLTPEHYQVKVVADGYEQIEEGYVIVEAGRQARIDLQVKKPDTHILVRSTYATGTGRIITLNCEYTTETGYEPYEVGFVYASQIDKLDGGTLVKCNVSSSFTTTLTDLNPGQYYFRAFVKNYIGIAYGEICSFTTFNNVIIDNLMIQTEDLGCVDWYEAETLCKESRVAGYSDWRLPTLEELKMMYSYRKQIPNLENYFYWSSDLNEEWTTGGMSTFYYGINMNTGKEGSNYASLNNSCVRAVRTVN